MFWEYRPVFSCAPVLLLRYWAGASPIIYEKSKKWLAKMKKVYEYEKSI